MALGQITLVDLSDSRTGYFSLRSNHPKIQTYSPDTEQYVPNYNNDPVEIIPSFYLGSEDVTDTITNFYYYINNKRVEESSEINSITGAVNDAWIKDRKILYINKNLIDDDFYLIEATSEDVKDSTTGLTVPGMTASLEIVKLTDGSTMNQIDFYADPNIIVQRENEVFEPNEVVLRADLSNFNFGDAKKVIYQFYKEDTPLGREQSFIPNEKLELNYTLINVSASTAGSYFLKLFDEDYNDLDQATTSISLLKDGLSGSNAYTLNISETKPVILCDETENGYIAQKTDKFICSIRIYDGLLNSVPIEDLAWSGLGGGSISKNNIKFSPIPQDDGSYQIEISWSAGAVVSNTAINFDLIFNNEQTTLSSSLTVLALTGGKNGEDARLLFLEADRDRFTSANTSNITIIPRFYIGSKECDPNKVKYTWTITGDNRVYEEKKFIVERRDVTYLAVVTCTATYLDDNSQYTDKVTITDILDPYHCELICDQGNFFVNGKIENAKITCSVYQTGAGRVSPSNAIYTWYYFETDKEGNEEQKTIQSSKDNFIYYSNPKMDKLVIYCDVDF